MRTFDDGPGRRRSGNVLRHLAEVARNIGLLHAFGDISGPTSQGLGDFGGMFAYCLSRLAAHFYRPPAQSASNVQRNADCGAGESTDHQPLPYISHDRRPSTNRLWRAPIARSVPPAPDG
jgi:hypothetical protein